MRALTESLYSRLAGDDSIVSALSQYRGAPGIFSARIVPADAKMPYVHIRPPVIDVPWDTLTRLGREISQDIAIYFEDSGSEGEVEDLAMRIRDLMHNRPLVVDGWHCAIISASGPIDAPEESGYTGRLVTVRVRLQRE